MRHGKIIVVIVLVILGGLFLWGVTVRSASGGALPAASGSPVPSLPVPSLLPSATPAPHPASTVVVHWARHWRSAAVGSLRRWNRARSAFGLRVVSFYARGARTPDRAASRDRWMDAGRGWKYDRGVYDKRFAGLWHEMNNPHGNAWERWRPLVRWVWPANLVNTVIEIMHWESSGSEFVWCGHVSWAQGEATDAAYGLLQLKPRPHSVYGAFSQIVYAYYHKYLPAGGWSPWAGCRAFD